MTSASDQTAPYAISRAGKRPRHAIAIENVAEVNDQTAIAVRSAVFGPGP
jgi:hypothetical protein